MSQVTWSVCLSVYWARGWAVQKRLNRSSMQWRRYTRARKDKWPCWNACSLAVALAEWAGSKHWTTTDLRCSHSDLLWPACLNRRSRCYKSDLKGTGRIGYLNPLSNTWFLGALTHMSQPPIQSNPIQYDVTGAGIPLGQRGIPAPVTSHWIGLVGGWLMWVKAPRNHVLDRGSRSPYVRGTLEGGHELAHCDKHTHECIAPASGECACQAYAADECISRHEGWQDKRAMRPLTRLLWTLVWNETVTVVIHGKFYVDRERETWRLSGWREGRSRRWDRGWSYHYKLLQPDSHVASYQLVWAG